MPPGSGTGYQIPLGQPLHAAILIVPPFCILALHYKAFYYYLLQLATE